MTSRQRANVAVSVFVWLALAFFAVWRETGSFTSAAVTMLLADLMWRHVVKPICFDFHEREEVLQPAESRGRRNQRPTGPKPPPPPAPPPKAPIRVEVEHVTRKP